MTELLIPKYLTKAIALQAIYVALYAVMGKNGPLRPRPKRNHCHIVILVPGMEDACEGEYPDWPNYPLTPVLLCEYGYNCGDAWEHPYDSIARCKALQLWTGRNDGRAGVIPHLLFPGDTPYWGGVKRDGIVVACSGVEPYFDRLIAGIVCDTLIALAHDAYEKDPERKVVDFLP